MKAELLIASPQTRMSTLEGNRMDGKGGLDENCGLYENGGIDDLREQSQSWQVRMSEISKLLGCRERQLEVRVL